MITDDQEKRIKKRLKEYFDSGWIGDREQWRAVKLIIKQEKAVLP
jgi:hypothetical protein